jgi:hypothetical protein
MSCGSDAGVGTWNSVMVPSSVAQDQNRPGYCNIRETHLPAHLSQLWKTARFTEAAEITRKKDGPAYGPSRFFERQKELEPHRFLA